jgi:hypothetical protein
MQKQVVYIITALIYRVKCYKYTYTATVYSEYVMLGLLQLMISIFMCKLDVFN